jgi:YfiH family protein
MIAAAQNGASYYQFKNLMDCRGIDHKIFTRNAGHSPHPFAGLNVSYGIGDEAGTVSQNRAIISRIMGDGEFIYVHQVHGSEIAVLNADGKENTDSATGQRLVADAIVTDQLKKFLVIQVADCQSVLMFEPTRQVVANIHCGWRGSIQNIIGRTVDTMKQEFGCRPDEIRAGIGPSLGPCCAEFINYRIEIPKALWGYKDSNDHFDFWSVSFDQLMKAGVAEVNIESSQICTRCHTEEFFSYRSEKTTGRFAAVIGLLGLNNEY